MRAAPGYGRPPAGCSCPLPHAHLDYLPDTACRLRRVVCAAAAFSSGAVCARAKRRGPTRPAPSRSPTAGGSATPKHRPMRLCKFTKNAICASVKADAEPVSSTTKGATSLLLVCAPSDCCQVWPPLDCCPTWTPAHCFQSSTRGLASFCALGRSVEEHGKQHTQ